MCNVFARHNDADVPIKLTATVVYVKAFMVLRVGVNVVLIGEPAM